MVKSFFGGATPVRPDDNLHPILLHIFFYEANATVFFEFKFSPCSLILRILDVVLLNCNIFMNWQHNLKPK
jgi:hypothetical protein